MKGIFFAKNTMSKAEFDLILGQNYWKPTEIQLIISFRHFLCTERLFSGQEVIFGRHFGTRFKIIRDYFSLFFNMSKA